MGPGITLHERNGAPFFADNRPAFRGEITFVETRTRLKRVCVTVPLAVVTVRQVKHSRQGFIIDQTLGTTRQVTGLHLVAHAVNVMNKLTTISIAGLIPSQVQHHTKCNDSLFDVTWEVLTRFPET